jgi:phage-related protein
VPEVLRLVDIENFLYIVRVTQNDNPRVATIEWEGDSREILKSWPKSVQWDFGVSLREMQEGRVARLTVSQCRPSAMVSSKDADESTWYRMIYLARRDDVIYVLDCFEKDSRKTERHDIKRATARFKQVKQRLLEVKRDAKRKPAK